MSFSHVSPRNYTRMLKAEQLRNAQPAKPVIKSAPTPATHPMTSDQKARLAAFMAKFKSERAVA